MVVLLMYAAHSAAAHIHSEGARPEQQIVRKGPPEPLEREGFVHETYRTTPELIRIPTRSQRPICLRLRRLPSARRLQNARWRTC